LQALGRGLDGPQASAQRVAWIQDYLKIRDKRGALVRLKANAAQRAFEHAATRQNIVLKARQVGITTWVAARFFLATITQPGTVTVQVAHDRAAAEQIFRIVHRFLANLPEEWRMGALATSRANVRQLVFPRLDSEYRVETAADREAGRGLTIRHLHCSEVARWPGNPAETLAGLRAAVAPGGEVVLESTPNGAAGCFYDEWQRAEQTGTTRHFFPWWMEDGYRSPAAGLEPTDEERALQRSAGLDREQLAFRRSLRASFGRLAPQEFAEDPAECFLASGECVFDLEVLEKRRAELTPGHACDNGRLRTWFPAQPGRQYVIGVDPAGGGAEGDYSCAQVIDRAFGLQCAELHGHFHPAELARRVAELARDYNDALVAVERNNHGHAVLTSLERLERYAHVYEGADGRGGWLTNVATRPAMLESLVALVTAEPGLLMSERLLSECRTFVRRSNGSPAAAPGAHDDCVLAMAIAQQVRQVVPGLFWIRNRKQAAG